MTLRRGEQVAFVGRNGEGKTTMMRVLMRELEPFAGSAATGHNVNVGYYAQNQDDILKGNDTVYDTLERVAVGEIRTKLRDILAAFLFKGDDIDKKVSVLSGGERSRLAMARLMLHPYNLLALDEPTNHMDIRSKDVLKQALKNYDGTLIVVSHDRDFLNGLVDKVYEFTSGRVKEHLGGVDDFLRAKRAESFRDFEIQASKAAATSEAKPDASARAGLVEPARFSRASNSASTGGSAGAPSQAVQRAKMKEERKAKNRQQQLEKQIGELEAKMAELEKKLSAPTPEDDILELTRNYLELKRELDEKMNLWAEM
jgi:ATP-binding cassette subfamily F protein 3